MNELTKVSSCNTENSIFLLYRMPYSGFYHKDIFDVLKSNYDTKYKLIKDTFSFYNFVDLRVLKDYYPYAQIITTVSNPWTRIFKLYSDYLKHTKISLDDFVLIIEDDKSLKRNQYDYIFNQNPQGADFIFRNEFIEQDFLKFSKIWKNPILFKKEQEFNFNHKLFFKPDSQKIIENIFKKDIEFFYPNYLNS